MLVTLLLGLRLLLALVFLTAGLAKLADQKRSRQAIQDFGIPAVLAPTLGLLLPLIELALAITLVLARCAWWGALGALCLLLTFMVGIGVNLVRGRTTDCHGFGGRHSAPAGWPSLARYGALAALAGLFVFLGPAGVGPSVLAWLHWLTVLRPR